MKNARKIFTPAELEQLQARIARLETRTEAEVVCAVATESGRYDRPESLCGLVLALVALLGLEKGLALGGWAEASGLSLGGQVVTIVVGFTVGSMLASYWHELRRLFTSAREIDAEVQRGLHQVFSQHEIGGTRQGGGMLIYLSLYEHRLEIRCDHNLVAALPPLTLAAIRDAALPRLHAGEYAAGLLAALDRAEPALAQALPATGEPRSRLSDKVLLFHPRPR